MTADGIERFVERLASTAPGPNSANPFDFSREGNAARRRNLTRYLLELAERQPRVLLVGEAPGYRGMRITGVPFTNTVILEQGIRHFGLLGGAKGYEVPTEAPVVAAEPTATVMWQVLVELDFLPALWSAFPIHPHRPGNPLSNRTPTAAEAAAWSWSWRALGDVLGIERVIAVGNVAHTSMLRTGVAAPRVRHPAHGGRAKFAGGLAELLATGIDR